METKKKDRVKGAAKKWSERLKQIGEQAPPEGLMKIINKKEKPAKSAQDRDPSKDLEL